MGTCSAGDPRSPFRSGMLIVHYVSEQSLTMMLSVTQRPLPVQCQLLLPAADHIRQLWIYRLPRQLRYLSTQRAATAPCWRHDQQRLPVRGSVCSVPDAQPHTEDGVPVRLSAL